jgi:hypothetical protein
LASATYCLPQHQIVSGNWLKTTDIVKDLTKFEPETDPMPADGKVGIGNRMPLVVD